MMSVRNATSLIGMGLLAAMVTACGLPSSPTEDSPQGSSTSDRQSGPSTRAVTFVSMVVKGLKFKAGEPNQPQTRICYAVFAGESGFPNDASKVVLNGCKPVDSTVVSFLIEDLPASEGGYGISLFQDLNGNNKLDTRSIFGAQVPDEPFGFSNNPTGLRAPTYEEVRINPSRNGETITVNMRSI